MTTIAGRWLNTKINEHDDELMMMGYDVVKMSMMNTASDRAP